VLYAEICAYCEDEARMLDNWGARKRAPAPVAAPHPIKYEDCSCDEGRIWNNADDTSGQFHECSNCDYRRRARWLRR